MRFLMFSAVASSLCEWERGELNRPPGTVTAARRVCAPGHLPFKPGPTNWFPWRFVHGFDYLKQQAAGWLDGGAPAILGRNDSWLPVTHQRRGGRNPNGADFGMWFYFGLGCSDVYWHTGRTLVARNRAHAAVMLSRIAGHASGQQYVARHLMRTSAPALAELIASHSIP